MDIATDKILNNNMFKHLLNDPNFLPITIIFIALVLVAIWQKLDRFFIPLALVYSLYVIITIVMSPDQKSQFELPMKEIVKVPVDTLNEVINKKQINLRETIHVSINKIIIIK